MMSARMLPAILPFIFETDDSANASKWKSWVRGFELFAKANKVEDDDEKLNWMLQCAGEKVQSIYYTLPDTVAEAKRGPLASGFVPFQTTEYFEAILKLQNFFEPKRNTSYERHIFRQMKQTERERIDTFVIRLREQAERCDFENQLEENIKDQITSGCTSNLLRRKILGRGDRTLDDILNQARILEVVEQQQRSFESSDNSPKPNESKTPYKANTEVCKIDFKRKFNGQRRDRARFEAKFNGTCGRCGFRGHKANDEKCPAKGKECTKCGGLNHFAKKCFSRGTRQNAMKRKAEDTEPAYDVKREKHESQINMMMNDSLNSDDVEDVFAIDVNSAEVVSALDAQAKDNRLWCKVGNIEHEAVVDSGTRYNVVDRETWAEWKAKGIATVHRQKGVDIGFNAYGGTKLKFLGMFKAKIEIEMEQTIANFYVANEVGKFLLGYETAFKLKVLKIGGEVNQIESEAGVQKFGKIKGVLVNIPLKPNVNGVVQPYRKTPVPLEKRVTERINEMLARDIIEKVDGVAKWVSPMVITPKADDIRICDERTKL